MATVMNTLFKNVLKNAISQQARFYSRWNHRRPVKVYSAEEYKEMEKGDKSRQSKEETISTFPMEEVTKIQSEPLKETNDVIKYKIKEKKNKKPLIATYQKTGKIQTTDMLETVIDDKGNYIYKKMKNNDHRVGMIMTEVKSKKEKSKRDLVLLEGKRLIKDALLSGCHLKYILFSRINEVEYLKPFLPKFGSHLYKMPYKEMQMWSDLSTNPGIMAIVKTPDTENFTPKESLPLTVICDNIREPGNLGSILRICAAVGCQKVILSKGCVDLWDSKVLRSSVGAHFKLRIQNSLDWKSIEEEISENSNVFIADNKIISSDGGDNQLVDILERIPVLPYYSVNFKVSNQIYLIIGGETFGISTDSYEIAQKMNGARLNIPLSNDVDSLNVGAALSIIAFELKKQFVQKPLSK